MQTVKDWLTPSKWMNPWDEENVKEQLTVSEHLLLDCGHNKFRIVMMKPHPPTMSSLWLAKG